MFRQVKMRSGDQDYQRILWNPNSEEAPIEYRLTTVTYGTSCAPYLAIRTLKQLVQDQGSQFPLGAHCLEHHTYIDDIFTGTNDLSTAIQTRIQLVDILRSAGIELDKWAANNVALFPDQVQPSVATLIESEESVTTLGLHWNSSQDIFKFSIRAFRSSWETPTKRVILSDISRLFDPLGWLAPITVSAKILMQDLWILKCDWDSVLPASVLERWSTYCNSLSDLSFLSIDRWLGDSSGKSCQIHGFSDASSRAYAAVVYLRISEDSGQSRISLLAAKSKVAPVKTISVPNLELCGATLLVKLLRHLQRLDFLQNLPIYAWSDSQIVLTWLRKHPSHWKTFVANRISYIQTELPSAIWSHVPTRDNPADLATRGSSPIELAQNNLWWQGPTWLSQAAEYWPHSDEAPTVLHLKKQPTEPEILTRFSSLTRLLRVVARCRRLLSRLRNRKSYLESPLPFLSSIELSEARNVVIKLAQSHAFATEITLLSENKCLPKRHPLCKLNPILDEKGILCVGGRLSHSALTSQRKHPPILPHTSAFSILYARSAHLRSLHGGPTLTSCILMHQVWILGRRRLVKSIVRQCVICQRHKPRLGHQLMSDLPTERVTPARAFSCSGLDYAGPFQIRASKGRGYKSYKGYIVLFVCFVSRAVHLELVSDLTTDSFIAAFRRFVGRRGICRKLFSDNATTFHGADAELQRMFLRSSDFYHEVADLLANEGTDWTFIPPLAPHNGGIWEAGVKSTKHHLKRVIGEHILTFEELSTLLVQIEACLNSRPLGPMSSDMDDLNALTPSHFLTGGAPTLLPDDGPVSGPENRLSRFQLLQRLLNDFWRRWSSEYLQTLQERNKWRTPQENFAVGRLVLVKDDRYPPSKWPLGRVIEVHPGPDGLVRVTTVKTVSSILRRHIAGLCPLFLENETLGAESTESAAPNPLSA